MLSIFFFEAASCRRRSLSNGSSCSLSLRVIEHFLSFYFFDLEFYSFFEEIILFELWAGTDNSEVFATK